MHTMSKITEIVISRSAYINLGNRESLNQFVSMKAELEELDDDVEEAAKLAARVERSLVRQLVRSYKVRKKSMRPAEVARHHGLSYVPKEEK